MTEEPDNLVLALLREMRAARARTDQKIDDLAESQRSEMRSLGAAVASDMLVLEKRLGEQTPVVGDGMLIGELEARLNRVEQNLGLPLMETRCERERVRRLFLWAGGFPRTAIVAMMRCGLRFA